MQQDELVALHQELCDKARALMVRKNNDYSGQANVFGNLDACDVVTGGQVSTEMGILIRIADKVSRCLNLEVQRVGQKRDGVISESFEDSMLDIINYAALGVAKSHERAKPPPVIIKRVGPARRKRTT